MKLLKRLILPLTLLLTLLLTLSMPSLYSAPTPRFSYTKFKYETGQIIAISETNYDPSTFFFEAVTGSRYGHIGIVQVDKDGIVNIYESNPPIGTQKVSVKEFLKRSKNDSGKVQATVLNINSPLTQDETIKLVNIMDELVKKEIPYNYTQMMNSYSKNCSEFVHTAFKQLGRIGIGKVETKADLNLDSFDGFLLRSWESLAGKFPRNASFITPASIVFSDKVHVVASNLPYKKILSDLNILKSWKKAGGLAYLADMFDQNEENILYILESKASDTPYKTKNKVTY